MINNKKSLDLRATPELENFAKKYTSGGISNWFVSNYFKSIEILISKCKNIQSVHEIGCGEGFSTLRLEKFFPEMSASEYVEELVAKARKRLPEINIFQESVYDLQKQSVDLVFLLEVLEHLDYPQLALQQIKAISNKYVIVGVPREPLWRLLNMCRFKYLKSFGNTPGHLNHWSKKSIIEFLNNHLGTVVAVETPYPWTICLVAVDQS